MSPGPESEAQPSPGRPGQLTAVTGPVLFAAVGFPVFLFLDGPAFVIPDPTGKTSAGEVASPTARATPHGLLGRVSGRTALEAVLKGFSGVLCSLRREPLGLPFEVLFQNPAQGSLACCPYGHRVRLPSGRRSGLSSVCVAVLTLTTLEAASLFCGPQAVDTLTALDICAEILACLQTKRVSWLLLFRLTETGKRPPRLDGGGRRPASVPVNHLGTPESQQGQAAIPT